MIRPGVAVLLSAAVLAASVAACGSDGSVTAGVEEGRDVDRAEALLEDPLFGVAPVEGQPAPEASLRRAGEQVRVGLAPLAEHQAVVNESFEGEYLAVAQRYLEALVEGGWSEIDVFCLDRAGARLVTLDAARWVGYRIDVGVTVNDSGGVAIGMRAPPSGSGGPRPEDIPPSLHCLEKSG